MDSLKMVKRDTRKTLNDLLNQDYHDMYREMMKPHHESIEDAADEEFRLRRIVGDDNYEILKEGSSRRRGFQIRSVLGRKRARSQALRREKLNSQSLRSHQDHMRHSLDESLDSSELNKKR